ncbi:hypothetical protein M899_2498 [Bacteriovorax sp. BSW11_IV]|nr:hypothetical protein M899_2498 [Bacteriovorax sp. BSW11_IV]
MCAFIAHKKKPIRVCDIFLSLKIMYQFFNDLSGYDAIQGLGFEEKGPRDIKGLAMH